VDQVVSEVDDEDLRAVLRALGESIASRQK